MGYNEKYIRAGPATTDPNWDMYSFTVASSRHGNHISLKIALTWLSPGLLAHCSHKNDSNRDKGIPGWDGIVHEKASISSISHLTVQKYSNTVASHARKHYRSNVQVLIYGKQVKQTGK